LDENKEAWDFDELNSMGLTAATAPSSPDRVKKSRRCRDRGRLLSCILDFKWVLSFFII